MKITTKGQVTIPQRLREQFGLLTRDARRYRSYLPEVSLDAPPA